LFERYGIKDLSFIHFVHLSVSVRPSFSPSVHTPFNISSNCPIFKILFCLNDMTSRTIFYILFVHLSVRPSFCPFPLLTPFLTGFSKFFFVWKIWHQRPILNFLSFCLSVRTMRISGKRKVGHFSSCRTSCLLLTLTTKKTY